MKLKFKNVNDFKEHTRVSKRICKAIFGEKTLTPMTIVQKHIENRIPISYLTKVDQSLTNQITSSSLWRSITSKTFRFIRTPDIFNNHEKIRKQNIIKLWEMKMDIQARSIWYKVIWKKVPTRLYLYQNRIIEEPNCKICYKEVETLEHLLFSCHPKWEIWSNALMHY